MEDVSDNPRTQKPDCQNRRPKERAEAGSTDSTDSSSAVHTLVITSDAFWPPKPKLLEMAVCSGISRAVLGT